MGKISLRSEMVKIFYGTGWSSRTGEMEAAYRFIRENRSRKQDIQKRYYDGAANQASYQQEDCVWLFSARGRGCCSKFHKPSNGLYKITKRLSHLTFQVEARNN